VESYEVGGEQHIPCSELHRSKQFTYLSMHYPLHASARSQEPDHPVVAVAGDLHRPLKLPVLAAGEANTKSDEFSLRCTSNIRKNN
jgi:hypothetical protein